MNIMKVTIIDKTISVIDNKEMKPKPMKNIIIHMVMIKSEIFLWFIPKDKNKWCKCDLSALKGEFPFFILPSAGHLF